MNDFEGKWYAAYHPDRKGYYAKAQVRRGVVNGKTVYTSLTLHKYLMNPQKGNVIDHLNHNSLDDRRCNMRETKYYKNSEHRKGANSNNKTGVRNVCYIKDENCYRVQMMLKGIRYKWDFTSNKFKEACDFAEQKRKELYGEFAGNG